MMTNGMFSTERADWPTPQWLFDQLNAEFDFTLDPCAFPETAKTVRFFSPTSNGLEHDWAPDRVFMNPPYGREVVPWIRKALAESRRGALVVALLPSRTDTQWWHDYVLAQANEVRFIRGRLKFEGAEDNPPFPSVIVVFGGSPLGNVPTFSTYAQSKLRGD